MLVTSIFLYALLWLSFALVHSLLAKASVKAVLKSSLSYRYRFVYNMISFAQLFYVFYLGNKLFAGFEKYNLPVGLNMIMLLAVVVGITITLYSLWKYNPSKFIGLTEWQDGRQGRESTLNSTLCTQGLNRFIRHPLYTGMFLMLWGMANSAFGLSTAVFGSLYLLVGQHFEERKLFSYYGEQYRSYKESVPAFFPVNMNGLKKHSQNT